MVDTDLVCVYSSADSARVQRVSEHLLDGGIVTVLVPADRERRSWNVEVPAADNAAACAIIASVRER